MRIKLCLLSIITGNSPAFTGRLAPIHFKSNGVKNGVSKVETVVPQTESTRLALARYDITLDANPLGQHPAKIIPAAIPLGKWNKDPFKIYMQKFPVL